MTGISHKLAQRYLRAAADGLIRDNQRVILDAHLRECDSCRAEADELNALEARLQKNFQARWDASDGPSRNVMTTIQSRSRRIIMTNRINTGLKMLAGIAAMLVLGLIFSSVIRQLQKSSTNTSASISTTQQAIGADKSNGGLIAFVSEKSGDPEIYTMYADGSNLTNLTNDPAYDGKPFWSPNGKRIAFESDRSGLPQVYLMDANGSNVTQVTDDEAAHLLPYNIAGSSDPWSPDGSKLLLLQQNPGDGTWTLGSININGENKTSIITGKIQVNGISWSPDGKHIGFILNDSQSTDENDIVPEIYIANTDGDIPWAATEFLQQNEQFSDTGYTWSPDGQAITFKTFLQKTNPQWTVYEVRLDDHSAIEKYSTESFSLIKWQDGVAVTLDSNGAFNWLNMDRISGVLDPYENCDIPFAGSYINQSPGGNWAIASYCPNGDHWFYWANSDGTEIKQLFDSPISAKEDNFTDEIIWSPDDTFVAFVFNLASSVTNDMYILNVEKSLSNPTIQPLKIESSYSPSWQPQPDNNVVENVPTPAPQPSGLIAFASMQDGEIFTMKADGSEVTNLTNNPATDGSPAWSSDGTRIAFTSDRSGDTDIYVMNADGSNVSRLTDDRGFEGNFSWSPDGQRIVYNASENSLNQNGRLMVMNADGSNKIPLMDQPGSYTFLGWSPDGKTIVYQATNLGDTKDTRIMSANVDGTSTLDGPYFEGDSGRWHYQIHWETPEQFITVSMNSEQPKWGMWNITRFFTTGDYTNYNGNNPILVTSDSPIIAIFDKTYVVESQDALTWFVYDGAPIPSSPWKFSDICKTPGDPNLLNTSHTISPDRKHDFVSFYCGDDNGSVSFFLMNEDGTEIHQLGKPITNTNFIPFDVSWSSDGKYVTMPIADRQDQELYLFDIEKMKNDPSVQPIQLTTDRAPKHGPTWQPQPKEEPVVIKATEETPTPTPLAFSLTVQEAEILAGLDVFEPSLTGFNILEPSYLPEGYVFQGAAYDSYTRTVTLEYVHPPEDPSGAGIIHIYQKRGVFPKESDLPSHATPTPIGDVMGEFSRGVWIFESGAPTPRWDGSADYYALNWQKDGISFMVDFIGGEGIPNINLQGLRAIAESMK